MLDFVPLRRARREVADLDLKLGLVGEFLQPRGARVLIARGQLRRALSSSGCPSRLSGLLASDALGSAPLCRVPRRGASEAALVHAASGDTGDARRLANKERELARAFERPRTLGMALRACGLVEGGSRGLSFLTDAATTLEPSRARLELVRARADYRAAMRRAGRRVQARAELDRALAAAHHCGARRIPARARAELIAVAAEPGATRSPAVMHSPPASSGWRCSLPGASPTVRSRRRRVIDPPTSRTVWISAADRSGRPRRAQSWLSHLSTNRQTRANTFTGATLFRSRRSGRLLASSPSP